MNFFQNSVDPRNAVLSNPNARLSPSNFSAMPTNIAPEVLRMAGISPEQLTYQKEQQELAERIKGMQELHAEADRQRALESLVPQEEPKAEKTLYQQYLEAPETTDTWLKKAGRAIGNTANAWSDVIDNAMTKGAQASIANGLSFYHHLAGNPKDAYYYELKRRALNAESDRINKAALGKVLSTEPLDRRVGETAANTALAAFDVLGAGAFGKGLKTAKNAVKANVNIAENASKAAQTIVNKANKIDVKPVKQAQANWESKLNTFNRLSNDPTATARQVTTAKNNLTSAKKYLDDALLKQAQTRAPLLARATGFEKSANTAINVAEEALKSYNKNLIGLASLTVPITASNLGNTVDTGSQLPKERVANISQKIASAKLPESSKMPLAESGNSTPYYLSSDRINGGNGAISQGYGAFQNNLLSLLPKYPTSNSDGNVEQEVQSDDEPSIPEQYTIPQQAMVNASMPTPVNTSSVDAPPFRWKSLEEIPYVENEQLDPYIRNLNAQSAYLEALRKRAEGLATQQQQSREAIERNKIIADQIRNQNESNPWFWVSNVLGAIPAMRQGVSPFELYERSQLASISADPAYRANQAIIDEVARVSPTELEKLKELAALNNVNDSYNAARLGEVRAENQNQHNRAIAELGIKDKTAAANVWKWIQEARNDAAKIPIMRKQIEVEVSKVANATDRNKIYEIANWLKQQELAYKALEAQSRVDANNAKTQQTKAVQQMVERASNR